MDPTALQQSMSGVTILSLFSGCGGLDLGFRDAGFRTGLAFDIRPHSIASWNRNNPENQCGHVADVNKLKLACMDKAFGSRFAPRGVVGGPPCQSFTRANHFRSADDPRNKLVRKFFTLALRLHRRRRPLDFIVMENVREVAEAEDGKLLRDEVCRLEDEGFTIRLLKLNALDFGVPQHRHRLFLIALNEKVLAHRSYSPPTPKMGSTTVEDAISGLPEPLFYSKASACKPPHHPNHWCMTPKSNRFRDGSLKPGEWASRSFKTLSWEKPSIAVSYGHREVHVHPNCKRRLSVFEAMKLQGFPNDYVLEGTLSAQIDQVSEAVPPPLAEAVAQSVADAVGAGYSEGSSRVSRLASAAGV